MVEISRNLEAFVAESELQLNDDGSLIDLGTRKWLVCFVPPLNTQWWHKFVFSPFKHVFAMRKNHGEWTLFEPWWSRLLVVSIDEEKAIKYLLWAYEGDVLVAEESSPGHGSQMRGWMNCAGLVSYMLGRSYWVWTPSALHRKLVTEDSIVRARMPAELKRHLEARTKEKHTIKELHD